MFFALSRKTSAICLDLSVNTIFFNRASRFTGSRAIRPFCSISPSTRHDVDRVTPKRCSMS